MFWRSSQFWSKYNQIHEIVKIHHFAPKLGRPPEQNGRYFFEKLLVIQFSGDVVHGRLVGLIGLLKVIGARGLGLGISAAVSVLEKVLNGFEEIWEFLTYTTNS